MGDITTERRGRKIVRGRGRDWVKAEGETGRARG